MSWVRKTIQRWKIVFNEFFEKTFENDFLAVLIDQFWRKKFQGFVL